MEAKVFLNQTHAATLYALINLMTGPVAFRAKREEVQKKIAKAWPEILEKEPSSAEDRDPKEKRNVILNEREQKAMGEGLLTLVNKPEANGADFSNCMELAGILRISNWFRKAATVQEVPEFEEDLDGEELLADAEGGIDVNSAGLSEAAPAAE